MEHYYSRATTWQPTHSSALVLLTLASTSLVVFAGPVDHVTPPFHDDSSPAHDSSVARSLLLAGSLAHSTTPPCHAAAAPAADSCIPLLLATTSPVHATPPSSYVVFRAARRLGVLPRHVLLSSDLTAGAPAPAPDHVPNLFLEVLLFILALIVICVIVAVVEVGLFFAISWLLDRYGHVVAEKYATARSWWTEARKKASRRVLPLAEDTDGEGAGQ